MKWNIILISVVFVYFGICLFFYLYQESFLFHPRATNKDYVYDFDYPFEEKLFETPHLGVIHTLKFKVKNPKGLVFYLHGNAGSLRDWGWIYPDFINRGYDLFIMDYRGYGKSKGELSETNMHADASFLYDELKKHYAEQDIIIYGRSIGTGIAAKLAESNFPKAVILESPFYSIRDVAQKIAPIFPLELLLKYKFKSFKSLEKAKSPIYIIHGTNDNVVPFKSGEKLYLNNQGKVTFFKVAGGQHNDLSQYAEFKEMLNEVLGN
jgi:hypothetical protein